MMISFSYGFLFIFVRMPKRAYCANTESLCSLSLDVTYMSPQTRKIIRHTSHVARELGRWLWMQMADGRERQIAGAPRWLD